jgi:hypothetical protein
MKVGGRWTGREAGFLRQAMRLTVRDFATDLGVNPRTISRWESTDLSPDRQHREAPLSVAPSRGAGLAVDGVAADLAWHEPGRMVTTLDTTSASHGRLVELFREADYLGVQVTKVPPATLAVEAKTRFREVRELIGGKQTFSAHREAGPLVGALWAAVSIRPEGHSAASAEVPSAGRADHAPGSSLAFRRCGLP